jgi:phage-related protein
MAISLPIVSKFDDKGIKDAESGFDKLKGGLGKLAGIGAAAAAATAAVGAAWVISSAKQLIEIEKLNAQTTAAIQSTGGAAGRSIEQINGLNASLEKLTGIEAEVIQEGQNMLLTFTNIKGTQFDEATEAALNLSVALGKDMQSSAMLVGKALNDPIGGISALSRAGIQFSEEQKGTIASLVELGDVAGAQTIILGELEKQFGGSAEAFGETTAGQIEKAKNSLGTLGESIAGSLLPILNSVLPVVTEFMDKLLVDPEFIAFQNQMATAFQSLFNALLPLMQPLMDLMMAVLPPLADIFTLLAPVIGDFVTALVPLIEGILPPLLELIKQILPIFMDLFMAVITPLVPIILKLVEAFVPLISAILPPLLSVVNALVPVFFALIDAFLPLIEKLLPPLLDLFMAIIEPLSELLVEILPFLIPVIEAVGDTFEWLIDNILNPLIEALTVAVGWFAQLFGFDGRSVNVGSSVPQPYRSGGMKLAEGGIVMPRPGGTLATIGEAGQAEAVIPLNKFDDVVGKRGGGGINIVVNAGMGTDGAAVGEQVVNAIRKYERTSGQVFARA